MLAVQVQYLGYLENVRHNKATEDLGQATLAETIRSDTAREQETHRSNIVHETQEWTRIDQTQQQINEAVRHNKASESISLISAQAQAQNAATNRMLANAQLPLIQAQADTQRAHTALLNEQTNTQKKQTSLTGQKYMTEQYNTTIAKSNSDWSDWLNFGKVINNIVPF